MKNNVFNWVDYLFLIITAILLILGGLGIYQNLCILLGILNCIFAISFKLIQSYTIKFPKNFILFLVFLLILLIHSLFNHGNFVFFWLFTSGGLFWLTVFNFQDIYKKYFTNILISLGIVMGIAYIYSLIHPPDISNLSSLFSIPSGTIKHGNIGELWAIIIPVLYLKFSQTKKYSYLFLLLPGIYFVTISFSRTALLVLATASIFIYSRDANIQKYKNILKGLFIIILFLFVFAGLGKSTLFSRPYFWEALKGLVSYPFGTGLGNFSLVSSDSNFVHDLTLEMVSGLGIFCVVFIYWLYKVFRSIFSSRLINVEAVVVFIAIFVDFSFNTTYTITSMVWLWFIALGIS